MSLTFGRDRSGQLYCSRVAPPRSSLAVHLPGRQRNDVVSYFSSKANSRLDIENVDPPDGVGCVLDARQRASQLLGTLRPIGRLFNVLKPT
jgi:hypothetical protein